MTHDSKIRSLMLLSNNLADT